MEPVQWNYVNLSEVEVEVEVRRLFPFKKGGRTHLHAENFKQWLWEAFPRENSETPPRTELWMFLVDIFQHMWFMGDIPQDLGWTFFVLIPKGTTDAHGIGLLDTLWKVVEAIIDTRLHASLQFHEILHGFRARRGTRTYIMEMKPHKSSPA